MSGHRQRLLRDTILDFPAGVTMRVLCEVTGIPGRDIRKAMLSQNDVYVIGYLHTQNTGVYEELFAVATQNPADKPDDFTRLLCNTLGLDEARAKKDATR